MSSTTSLMKSLVVLSIGLVFRSRDPPRGWGGTLYNWVQNRAGYISNHTIYDESKTKIPALAARNAGDPNPYVVGNDAARRYLTIAEECAIAGKLRAEGKP